MTQSGINVFPSDRRMRGSCDQLNGTVLKTAQRYQTIRMTVAGKATIFTVVLNEFSLKCEYSLKTSLFLPSV